MTKRLIDRPNVSLVIVDDNAGSLDLRSTALEQPGLEIWTATDPEEGLDLVYRKHPHIVLTDLVMPKMTGLAARGSSARF
jgi:CheY-like chemotaxis protein